MAADELGTIWTSEPLRISQSIKSVGKELDREPEKEKHEPQTPQREEDTVELSVEQEASNLKTVVVHERQDADDINIPGKNIDLTVG